MCSAHPVGFLEVGVTILLTLDDEFALRVVLQHLNNNCNFDVHIVTVS